MDITYVHYPRYRMLLSTFFSTENSLEYSDIPFEESFEFDLSFSMILRVKMILTVVSYERKNMIFCGKNIKITKYNIFNNVFCNRIFPYYRFLPIFKKWLGFHKSRLIFQFLFEKFFYRFQPLKTLFLKFETVEL